MKPSSGWAKIDRVINNQDHEIIYPKNELRIRALVHVDDGSPVDDGVIEKADAALGVLSVEFAGWMAAEVEKIHQAFAAYSVLPTNSEIRTNLFRIAHDMKGNAGMFGYPLVAEAAKSLAGLLNSVTPETIPLELVKQHVRAIRALASSTSKDQGNQVALEIVRELQEKTKPLIDAYQAAQAAGRPAAPDAMQN